MLEFLDALREAISQTLRQSLPEPQASLLLGMVLGVKSGFPSDFYQALRVTGTLHVVVVSGYNITVLINALGRGLVFLPLKARFFVIVLGIFLFVSLVGPEAPVIRAAIMGTIALLATVLGRQRDALRAFLIAGMIMLIGNFLVEFFPMLNQDVLLSAAVKSAFGKSWLFDLSFQLSFLATLGLIILFPIVDRILPGRGAPLREDLATTLAAQIMVWPLIAYRFGQASLFSPLVNALVLWTVPIATVFGMVTTTLALFVSQIGYLIMLPVGLLLTYFTQVVRWFSFLNFGFFTASPFSVLALFFYYLVLGGGLWFLSQSFPRKQKTS